MNPKVDKLFKVGIFLNILAALIYFLIRLNNASNDAFFHDEPVFFINFILSVIYFIVVVVNSIYIRGVPFFERMSVTHFLVALSLFCIGAYTLNLGIGVFQKFSEWSEVYLFLMLLPLSLLPYLERFPVYVRGLIFFMIGAGLVMSLYFTIYLAPYLVIGFIGTLFFGIGSLLLAPLFLSITYLVQFFKRKNSRVDVVSFTAGLLVPVLILSVYLYQWNKVRKLVHEAHASIITRPDNTLPDWVLLSQKLDDDYFTKALVMGNLVYATPRFGRGSDWFGLPNTSIDKLKRHDPLVFSAFALFGSIPIDEESRLKILEFKYSGRHYTQRKLWSDDDLKTSEVLTNIELYPEYHLSYTEKTISIQNTERRWSGQQEALYTFHLPEGSVATSLSLWINGVEQPSHLTTKQKADSAYVEIVGVEQRDPSLLHWQEGNKVTVTVFPCTSEEIRVFKIGVTSPLKENEGLTYENIYFEGPDAENAMETTKIKIMSSQKGQSLPAVIQAPSFFENILPNQYLYTGEYQADWSFKLGNSPINNQGFCFNNSCYEMKKMELSPLSFDPEKIYLDINASWTEQEFSAVLKELNTKRVFVFYDEMIQVNESNKMQLFSLLNKNEFSLFPLHEINPENSLLISKSSDLTPNLDDLKNTKFRKELEGFMKKEALPIQLFSLNPLSSYLKSLKEFQVFNTTFGDIALLHKIIQEKSIPNRNFDSSTVYIDEANIQLQKTDSLIDSKAPNHLLRLFAYNQLMKKIGKNYFDREKYEEDLFGIANEAFIASPISSMIVLETQKDYDRFGIKDNENSLGNASMNGKGAAPEPHEWALIAMAALVLLYLYRKKSKSRMAI